MTHGKFQLILDIQTIDMKEVLEYVNRGVADELNELDEVVQNQECVTKKANLIELHGRDL